MINVFLQSSQRSVPPHRLVETTTARSSERPNLWSAVQSFSLDTTPSHILFSVMTLFGIKQVPVLGRTSDNPDFVPRNSLMFPNPVLFLKWSRLESTGMNREECYAAICMGMAEMLKCLWIVKRQELSRWPYSVKTDGNIRTLYITILVIQFSHINFMYLIKKY
jgi:hypothetical protein